MVAPLVPALVVAAAAVVVKAQTPWRARARARAAVLLAVTSLRFWRAGRCTRAGRRVGRRDNVVLVTLDVGGALNVERHTLALRRHGSQSRWASRVLVAREAPSSRTASRLLVPRRLAADPRGRRRRLAGCRHRCIYHGYMGGRSISMHGEFITFRRRLTKLISTSGHTQGRTLLCH